MALYASQITEEDDYMSEICFNCGRPWGGSPICSNCLSESTDKEDSFDIEFEEDIDSYDLPDIDDLYE